MEKPSDTEVGTWMAGQLAEHGSLRQRPTAQRIAAEFGAEFLYTNKNGNLAIRKAVLDAFHAASGDSKVWKGYPVFGWFVREGSA